MNFKQRLLFILFMSIGMGTSMSWLGMANKQGINSSMWQVFFISILPTIAFAFVFNLLVVNNLSNWIIKWRTKKMNNEVAIRLKNDNIRGWIILLTMSFTMSTRALLINGMLFHMTPVQFIFGFFGTLTTAYFIRDVFIMPIVRRLVFRVKPA